MKEIACVKKYENETHYRFRARIAHEGLKTRDQLQITARITLSIHAIFVNVKKICKKHHKFLNCSPLITYAVLLDRVLCFGFRRVLD